MPTETLSLGTIIVGLVLLIVVGLVIYKMVRDKRAAKACGQPAACCGCPIASKCSSNDENLPTLSITLDEDGKKNP